MEKNKKKNIRNQTSFIMYPSKLYDSIFMNPFNKFAMKKNLKLNEIKNKEEIMKEKIKKEQKEEDLNQLEQKIYNERFQNILSEEKMKPQINAPMFYYKSLEKNYEIIKIEFLPESNFFVFLYNFLKKKIPFNCLITTNKS